MTATNTPTSGFPAAASLTGDEIVGIVQSGVNVKTTLTAIATYSGGGYADAKQIGIGAGSNPSGYYSIAIGQALSSGYTSIAIGYDTHAEGSPSIAIGEHSVAMQQGSVAIGTSYSTTAGSIVIGGPAISYSPGGIVIGAFTVVSTNSSGGIAIGGGNTVENMGGVVIGNNSEVPGKYAIGLGGSVSAGGDYSISIGFESVAGNLNNIAIGNNARPDGAGHIAIGYNTTATQTKSTVIGYKAKTGGYGTIALGAGSYAQNAYSISIGFYSQSQESGVCIGTYTQSVNGSIAIGYDVNATSIHSIAMLGTTGGAYAMAFGKNSSAQYANSVVFGLDARDFCQSSFVVRGGGSNGIGGAVFPTTHAQKLVGTTITAVSASTDFTDGDHYSIIVTYGTPGEAGNELSLNIIDNTGTPNSPTNIDFEGLLTIRLGTNGSGVVNATVATVLALFPSNGYTAFSSTSGSQVITTNHPGTNAINSFSGGVDQVTNVVLTTDGATPSATNLPATSSPSVSRLSCQVVAYQTILSNESSGDVATFVLTGAILLRDGFSDYTIIGNSDFVLESSTDGAADWSVPTVSINSNNKLYITVDDQGEALNWLGFVDIQSNQ